MGLEWLILVFLPVIGHVLYGLPPNPGDPDGNRITLHNGDGFSVLDEPPSPSRLLRLRAVSDEGETPLTAAGSRETGVAVDVSAIASRPCWIVVETPRTLIELAPEKFHGYLGHEGLDEVIASRTSLGRASEPGREMYSKYVKIALNDAGGSLRLRTQPVGLAIEIVPLLDAELSPGATLPVVVLVGGGPAANLQLRVSHRASEEADPSEDAIYRTDAHGMASIPIDRNGIWRLHTISMNAASDGEADWESLWASLTFRL